MSRLQQKAAKLKGGFSRLSGADLDSIFMSQSQYLKREPSCSGNCATHSWLGQSECCGQCIHEGVSHISRVLNMQHISTKDSLTVTIRYKLLISSKRQHSQEDYVPRVSSRDVPSYCNSIFSTLTTCFEREWPSLTR